MLVRYNDPHAKKALDQISFEIEEGKTTPVVGMSGSGKTTLIKLLLGFYEPEDGSGARLKKVAILGDLFICEKQLFNFFHLSFE